MRRHVQFAQGVAGFDRFADIAEPTRAVAQEHIRDFPHQRFVLVEISQQLLAAQNGRMPATKVSTSGLAEASFTSRSRACSANRSSKRFDRLGHVIVEARRGGGSARGRLSSRWRSRQRWGDAGRCPVRLHGDAGASRGKPVHLGHIATVPRNAIDDGSNVSRSTAATAKAPFSTTSTECPSRFNRSDATIWLTGLSSARRMRSGRKPNLVGGEA